MTLEACPQLVGLTSPPWRQPLPWLMWVVRELWPTGSSLWGGTVRQLDNPMGTGLGWLFHGCQGDPGWLGSNSELIWGGGTVACWGEAGLL